MDLSKIIAISGKNGLFKLISQSKSNFVVESLDDGKRFPAFANDAIVSLDSVSIFTTDEDISLLAVFQAIYKKENGNPIPNTLQSNDHLKTYFEEILPNYDKERVYTSNIKKVLLWYNILIQHGLLELDEKEEAVVESEETQ